jgi:hypothetical protein
MIRHFGINTMCFLRVYFKTLVYTLLGEFLFSSIIVNKEQQVIEMRHFAMEHLYPSGKVVLITC